MVKKAEYKVYDWASNEVGSPIFNNYDDASDWITSNIEKVYGDLSDNEHDIQRDEYQIIELD